MILALILLFLFLLIGVSVLTAASASVGTATQRIQDRQTYYYARSVLDTLDETLQHGQLGHKLRDDAVTELMSSGKEEIDLRHTLAPVVDAPNDECGVTGMTLNYAGKAAVMKRDGEGEITEYSVAIDQLEMAFTVTYRGQEYRMQAVYSCRMWAVKEEGEWRWDEKWTVQDLRQ